MSLGGGFLKQMNDTMKYNRDLLGKRKSVREIYKEEIKNRETSHEHQSIEHVRERVAIALRRNRIAEIISRVLAIAAIIALVAGAVWVLLNADFSVKKKAKYHNKNALFKTVIYHQRDGTQLKTDYFVGGPKAADTYLKNGLKHQNSDSYYESGEQFRSALYYYDTLITEVYLFKTGDTITNFPKLDDDEVYTLILTNKPNNREVKFDYYDGKVIQGTYEERNLHRR